MFGSFFIAQKSLATNSDIVINEIGAYATSTHEWVEIYNKGSDPIDLTGWKFWEATTNHGLTVNSGDNILAPGEYAAIVQDDAQFLLDHSGFSGSVFDSSWGSLSENGEEIGLKDSGGNVIEQFTYLATPNHHSLERSSASLTDYSSANWREHASGDTVGSQNSSGSGGENTPPPETGGSSGGTGKPAAPTGSDALFWWSKIKINEVMADPGGGSEWVELYNPSTTNLDLTGGTLCDGRTASTCVIASISGNIPAFGWKVITLTSDHLNNSGDTVLLKDSNGTAVDQVTYGGTLLPKTGQALARKTDGVDSNADSADWAVTTQPTAGSANVIIAPVASNANSQSSQGGSQNPLLPEEGSSRRDVGAGVVGASWATSTSPLILNELLPDPEGSDLTDEFIEIKNISTAPVNLAGWKLGDTTKTFSLSGTIGAGEFIVFTRPVTGISLNNTTDEEVTVYNPSGAIADRVNYDSAAPGASYSRGANGTWHWTAEITKGAPNIIEIKDNVEILWKITVPKFAAPGDAVEFSAAGSADPRGGSLFYSWNFGDGLNGSGEVASHVFVTQGTYIITLSVSSSAGTVGQKKLTLTVAPGLALDNRSVVISEIFPNPSGPDTSEFIELYNAASSTADVSLWQLKLSSGKTFTLPNNTRLPAHGTLVFYRLVTKLSLLNSADTIELLTATGQNVDSVSYTRSFDGRSYTRGDKGWTWNLPTPGRVAASIGAATQTVLGQKITASTVTQPIKNFIVNTGRDIAAVRELAKGAYVRLTGLVTALPDTFSTQYFYVSDGSAGIQIYSNKKDFPELALGDQVLIAGKTSAANSIPRVNISRQTDVDILSINGIITPEPLALDETEDATLGSLYEVKGEVTKLTSNLMYVDDSRGEIPVYFKAGAHIDKESVSVGNQVKVMGILERAASGIQLWPRSQNDIELIETIAPEEKTSGLPPTAKTYGLVTAGGFGLIALSFITKSRWATILKLFAKKPH